MKRNKIYYLINSALIAAIYIIFTFLSSMLNLSYGPIQFRVSESLMIMSLVTPAAIPGLTIGCLISNLSSPYGIIDIIFGTSATFISAVLMYYLSLKFQKLSKLILIAIPALFNALIIGFEIALFTPANAYLTVFFISAVEIGISEYLVCLLLGLPLLKLIKKFNLTSFFE